MRRHTAQPPLFAEADLQQQEGVIWVRDESNKLLVPMPKAWGLNYFFAASPQTKGREVEVGDGKEIKFIIGGFHGHGNDERICPALNVDHLRAILALLSFMRPSLLDLTFEDNQAIPIEYRTISYPMNEFCRRYANSRGGSYKRGIIRLIGDLKDTWIRILYIKNQFSVDYTILADSRVYRRPAARRDAHVAKSLQAELHLNTVVLSEYFVRLLQRELLYIRLDVLKNLNSRLAQAMYVVLPSRAFHRDKSTPWTINATTLLKNLDYGNVSEFKSKRAQLFTQHKPNCQSILEQLDSLPMGHGTFRIQMVDVGEDVQLQCWRERAWDKQEAEALPSEISAPKPTHREKVLLKTWIEAGGSQDEYTRRLKLPQELTDYEIRKLDNAGIDVQQSIPYYRQVKALIFEDKFSALCAEMADSVQTKTVKIKVSPGAVFGSRIKKAVAAVAEATGKR